MEGYKFDSGIPMIGNGFVVVGIALSFGSIWTGCVGLFATLIDTGGFCWFVYSVWEDESFWEGKVDKVDLNPS